MDFFFEWDPNKERENRRRHKISFERAASIFHDPRMLTIFDDTHSVDEERWITVGLDKLGIPLVVSHTFLEEGPNSVRIRIISARKAERKEIKYYRE